MTDTPAKPLIRPWMANFLLVAASSLLTLGLTEGMVRGLGLFGPQRSVVDQVAEEVAAGSESEDQADASSSRWVIHPYRGLSPRPQKGEVFRATYRNVLGMSSLIEDPRELPEDDLVIGVFGGSVGSELAQTAGRAIEEAVRERYSTERNVRVVNFGVSG